MDDPENDPKDYREPWTAEEQVYACFWDVRQADCSSIIQDANYGDSIGFDEDVAKRIVACVNACKGLPTAFLERKAKNIDILKRPEWFEDALYREAAGCFRHPDKETKFAIVATWLIDLARRPGGLAYVEEMLLNPDLDPEEEAVRYCVNWLTSKGFPVTNPLDTGKDV